MSKRAIEEVSASVLEAPVSPGTISNLEQETSAALAVPHQEVREGDRGRCGQACGRNRLETQRQEALAVGRSNPNAGPVRHSREAKPGRAGVDGRHKFVGVLCSDRWMVYDEWPAIRRQVCWAHLNRNWEQHQERGGAAKKLADEWFAISSKVFDLWHAFRGGGLTRTELGDRMADRLDGSSRPARSGHA
ncbi:MAG: transposase [Gemmataceae bacterium]